MPTGRRCLISHVSFPEIPASLTRLRLARLPDRRSSMRIHAFIRDSPLPRKALPSRHHHHSNRTSLSFRTCKMGSEVARQGRRGRRECRDFRSRTFVTTRTGPWSRAFVPRIQGIEGFEGETLHRQAYKGYVCTHERKLEYR